ncbi:collagen-like triple helix repeat-containing protein [Enterocloster bolteae]|uniref:collagen-like triple helix repeat-containing protein n=1 Tax=Enterocloster bolteae TaxID=208479 RepID=UPI0027D33A5E|nr:collagen-like protein [Enterocloster bolteae]
MPDAVRAFVGNFKGPQGERGPQGIQGPAGPQGIQGPAGPSSADGINTVDTSGVLVAAGNNTDLQKLIDAIADKVMTKLLAKADIVQTESTATNKVPSSAYLKQVKDDINSNLMKSYDLLISSTSTTGINQVVDVDNYREILLCATHSSNGTIYNAAMIPIGLFKSTSAGSMFRCSGGSFFAQCYTANGSITASVSADGYCAKIYGIK